MEETKLYGRRFWLDRYLELQRFYGKPHVKFLSFYVRNGSPNSPYYRRRSEAYNRRFFGGAEVTPPPKELLEAYRNVHFFLANRFMLAYHRYDVARQFLKYSDISPSEATVLDYACGVADPAIYLGLTGADISVVDLDTKLLEFATWRLRQRNIDHTTHRAYQTEHPVDLNREEFDFVVMSEFLEHVRDPSAFLRVAIEKLDTGGILFDSFGREYTHTLESQHLREAKEAVESESYKQLHRTHFERIGDSDFWQKR